jgi:hypothetical protein
VLTGIPLNHLAAAKEAPPVAWIGGFLGAFLCRRWRRSCRASASRWLLVWQSAGRCS